MKRDRVVERSGVQEKKQVGECCANDVLEQAENGQVHVDIMTFAASLPCSSHSQDFT